VPVAQCHKQHTCEAATRQAVTRAVGYSLTAVHDHPTSVVSLQRQRSSPAHACVASRRWLSVHATRRRAWPEFHGIWAELVRLSWPERTDEAVWVERPTRGSGDGAVAELVVLEHSVAFDSAGRAEHQVGAQTRAEPLNMNLALRLDGRLAVRRWAGSAALDDDHQSRRAHSNLCYDVPPLDLHANLARIPMVCTQTSCS